MSKVRYTSSQKLDVVMDILKGDKTIDQICTVHTVSKVSAKKWKKFFLTNASAVFEIKNPKKEIKEEDSPDYLKSIIGNLTVENEVLKKALRVWG